MDWVQYIIVICHDNQAPPPVQIGGFFMAYFGKE